MLTALWYLAGLIGCFLIWNAERRLGRFGWCPTPRAITLSAFGALLGPLMLGMGLLFSLVDAFFALGDRLRGTWFTRPLCQRDND